MLCDRDRKRRYVLWHSCAKSKGARMRRRNKEKLAWRNMWARCTNTKHPSFPRYGGRGIVVCPRWRSFDNFLCDMGKSPDGFELERKNNALGYFPLNCCWASKRENAWNRRTTKLSTKKIILLRGLIKALGPNQTRHYQFGLLAGLFKVSINSIYNVATETCWKPV